MIHVGSSFSGSMVYQNSLLQVPQLLHLPNSIREFDTHLPLDADSG